MILNRQPVLRLQRTRDKKGRCRTFVYCQIYDESDYISIWTSATHNVKQLEWEPDALQMSDWSGTKQFNLKIDDINISLYR